MHNCIHTTRIVSMYTVVESHMDVKAIAKISISEMHMHDWFNRVNSSLAALLE